jgi:hypothetical protein
MTALLLTLSAIVTIGAAVPYIIEIIRGKAKPRVVSWFTWTLLTAIAAMASFADGQYPAAIFSACAALETGLIVVLGLKHGDRKFTRLDIVCQVSALVGVALWLVFDSPAIAVLASIAIDLIGCIPTLVHSWQKPYEETWITFLLMSIGGGLALLVVGSWAVTAVAYPLYIFIINLLLMAVIMGRLKYAVAVG